MNTIKLSRDKCGVVFKKCNYIMVKLIYCFQFQDESDDVAHA